MHNPRLTTGHALPQLKVSHRRCENNRICLTQKTTLESTCLNMVLVATNLSLVFPCRALPASQQRPEELRAWMRLQLMTE